MVKYIFDKIRPGRGFAHAFHLSIIAILPPLILVLVRLDFNLIALAILLLSKWRMFALHPRHWIAHIRTNAVDIIASVSFLVFMASTSTMWIQIVWMILFEIWLLYIKPGTSVGMVSAQAVIANTLGLVSIFLALEGAILGAYVLAFWSISYFCARHFLNIFDERHGRLISSIWAFFAAAIMWVLGHWLLFVGPIAQPALLVSSLAFGFAGLYYLEQTDRLSSTIRQQIILTMFAIVFVIIVFSRWGDATV
ncbi:hypothetical protein HZB74_00670 [Candidatus Saccharibacteria bacterium]|nr:hypothetical protein [Candidatus Saccharibacteria bacterium]